MNQLADSFRRRTCRCALAMVLAATLTMGCGMNGADLVEAGPELALRDVITGSDASREPSLHVMLVSDPPAEAAPTATSDAPPVDEDAAQAAPSSEPAARAEQSTATAAGAADRQARCEVRVRSVRGLLEQTRESRGGVVLGPLLRYLFDPESSAPQALDEATTRALAEQVANWPDSALYLATFAPDIEGRYRWLVQLDWPLAETRERAETLLALDTAQDLFRGLTLSPRSGRADADGWVLATPETALLYLLPAADGGTLIASHADLALPAEPYAWPDDKLLIACRQTFLPTEQDSGATWFSSFRFFTALEYSARLADSGLWEESVSVSWPPVTGVAAKALLGRVKQTFFTPRAAFAAAALQFRLLPAQIDSLIGLGPQVVFENGEMTILNADEAGPLSRHVAAEMSFTVLPGEGVFGIPDIIAQAEVSDPNKLLDDLYTAAGKANDALIKRETSPPWVEQQVEGRRVFIRTAPPVLPGSFQLATARNVVFMTRELDQDGKVHDYVCIGWTSTDGAELARRWLDLPRGGENTVFVPGPGKSEGQIWLNWPVIYRWVAPYVDLGLASALDAPTLPRARDINDQLGDGWIKLRVRYTGLEVTHEGALPAGLLVAPAMVSTSLLPSEGGTDLARERLAVERLKVLYHHARLFHKDLDRWPARVRELDGYVDFAGHPELLKLERSSQKESDEFWQGLFAGLLGDESDQKDADEEDADDAEESAIDDSLYVVDWGRDTWTLGIKPGTFEHLAQLYIDQNGRIHRVVKDAQQATATN